MVLLKFENWKVTIKITSNSKLEGFILKNQTWVYLFDKIINLILKSGQLKIMKLYMVFQPSIIH